VNVIDSSQQIGLEDGEVSRRHRVRNTLPGTPAFSPLVRRTAAIQRAQERKLDALALSVVARTRGDVMMRAAAFLQLSDSRASFAIENERPAPERARRWARAIGRAGNASLTIETLESLQREVIGDSRFVNLGLRSEAGFVGEHDRDRGEPIPEHISARADDLHTLMHGISTYEQRVLKYGMDAVAAAATIAFGFVYVHPFEDGNGRIHRWLIHHVLARTGYTPAGIVFPVSAAMLRQIDRYREVLESYSEPLLPHIQWEATAKGNVHVSNETRDYYSFFDATAHAEYLYHCIEETVTRDLPFEVAYLEAYDRFVSAVQFLVDMPQDTLDLLHRFLSQNGGRLSERARSKEFARLSCAEVDRIEEVFAETTGSLPSPSDLADADDHSE
jgi:hypothetical protein